MIQTQFDRVYTIVEEMPRYYDEDCEQLSSIKEKSKCAEKKMLEFIYNNIKYPAVSPDSKEYYEFSSKMMFGYIVNEDGTTSNFEILKGTPNVLTEQYKAFILSMKFTPGQHKGKVVKVKCLLPVQICFEQ